MMEYKGYVARVAFDEEQQVLHGEVMNTRDVITFQGESVAELKSSFHASVEDYLEFCKERGEEPEKPYSGNFVVRLSPEVHRTVALAAKLSGKSINSWVAERLHADAEEQLEQAHHRT